MNDSFVAIIIAVLGSGVINIVLNRIFAIRDKKRMDDEGTKNALRIIIKDRLRYLCEFYINQNWIYSDELEDIIVMHKCYHDDLNGNGYLNKLMERVKALEIRGIGVK